MVIWDLDDTFWSGTLAEGGIEFIAGNAALIKTLASRGIVSSIASKNDPHVARQILEREGIWEYFVFPSISFDPKGKRVAEIIRNASLRPDNVLLIDDNSLNLEEARFFNNGLMTARPAELLHNLLSHPRLAGRADPELRRLKQYQLLQQKVVDRQSTNLSNEEFLRASNIEIRFDYDIEANFDRVVELINRTNQLNYTKKRMHTRTDIELFKSSMYEHGISAACISCSDHYGDYGIIGFYALKTTSKKTALEHFVFSCRIMNMGLEQFVYEWLGSPQIVIAPDVAYGLQTYPTVDWVKISKRDASPGQDDLKLLLVGGCELLQLSSFCSSNRVEFVNGEGVRGDGTLTRYDDPSFITADRALFFHRGELIKQIAGWTYEEALRLDQAIADAKIIILAMRAVLRHFYVVTKEGVYVRMTKDRVNYHLKQNPQFRESFSPVNLDVGSRLSLIQRAFAIVGNKAGADASIFLLGANRRKQTDQSELRATDAYNELCRQFCSENPKDFHFVDVNEIIPEAGLVDPDRFNRIGYFELAKHIRGVVANRHA